MLSCTRRIQFCAGHRVMGHEGKCGHLHGHNFVLLLTAEATELDACGRIVDFAVLKELFGSWIEEHWDHGFIIYRDDQAASDVLSSFKASNGEKQKLYLLPNNPSAENLANYLLREVGPKVLAESGVRLTRVELWESENCCATAAL